MGRLGPSMLDRPPGGLGYYLRVKADVGLGPVTGLCF